MILVDSFRKNKQKNSECVYTCTEDNSISGLKIKPGRLAGQPVILSPLRILSKSLILQVVRESGEASYIIKRHSYFLSDKLSMKLKTKCQKDVRE